MTTFKQYRRKQIAELRPWAPGDDMTKVSVSAPDREAGSPKLGDMIARNPKNHDDQWLVSAAYFADNFEAIDFHDGDTGRGGDPFLPAAKRIVLSCANLPVLRLRHHRGRGDTSTRGALLVAGLRDD